MEDSPSSLANGHGGTGAKPAPEKKDQVDAGLRSLDHCMFFLPCCAPLVDSLLVARRIRRHTVALR